MDQHGHPVYSNTVVGTHHTLLLEYGSCTILKFVDIKYVTIISVELRSNINKILTPMSLPTATTGKIQDQKM